MATSGTVGLTSFDIIQIIESAVRRCGKLTSTITSEQLDIARQCLYWALTDLAVNRSSALWVQQRLVLPVVVGQARYPLPPGVERLLSPLLRQGSYSTGTVAAVTYATATAVLSAVATVNTAGTYTLALDSSPDGVTWTERGRSGPWYTEANTQLGVDAQSYPAELQWRVRIASGPAGAAVTASAYLYAGRDIPISLLNITEFSQLPNKNAASTTPLQMYYDRQTTPTIVLWPVPSVVGPQLVLWVRRAVQDVGALSGQLELPGRWHRAVTAQLALHLIDELPTNEVDRARRPDIEADALAARTAAEGEESDGAPLRLMPNIGVYTS